MCINLSSFVNKTLVRVRFHIDVLAEMSCDLVSLGD